MQPSVFYLILIQGKCSHQFSQKEKERGIFSKGNRPQQKQTLNPNKKGKRRKNKARKPKPKSIENAASLSAFLSSFLFFAPPFCLFGLTANSWIFMVTKKKTSQTCNLLQASLHQIAFGSTSTPLVREYG